MDEWIVLVIGAVLNGFMLAVGMIIGTRLTTKSMRKEAEGMLEDSETMQAIKKVIVDPDKFPLLVDKAITFFEDAAELVGSPEAKNFFKNVTEMMKELGGEPTEPKKLLTIPRKR